MDWVLTKRYFLKWDKIKSQKYVKIIARFQSLKSRWKGLISDPDKKSFLQTFKITATAINIYTDFTKCFQIYVSIKLLNHYFYAEKTTEIQQSVFSKFIQLRCYETELGTQPRLNPTPSRLTDMTSQCIPLFICSFKKCLLYSHWAPGIAFNTGNILNGKRDTALL